jgi:hypothetical protein
MTKAIAQNGKAISGYFLTNIGWEGFVGLFLVSGFLIFGQL